MRLTAKLEGGNPRVDANLTGQALLTLDPSAKRYAAQKLDLRVDGKLPGAEAKSLSMRGNLAFNGQKSALDLSALEVLFQGEITDPAARATNVEASVAVPAVHGSAQEPAADRETGRARQGRPGRRPV